MVPRATTVSRHGVGFWLITFAFVTAMAFSTVPTPLYPLYQLHDGFSTFTVTIIFAAYAVGVIASLLLAGHLSDWVGRKRVMVTALAIELVAAAIFLTQPPLAVLIVARIVTGLGVGMLTATATAHLQELHRTHRPHAGPQRFETVSTAANIGGLGLGTLVAGLLAQYALAPLRLPYLVFATLLVLAIIAVLLTPETVVTQPVRPSYRPQRISIERRNAAKYAAGGAAAFASFAVFGLFTSLVPGFVAGTLHHPSRALAGLLVFAVFGSAALTQTLTSRLDVGRRSLLGLVLQVAGLVLLVVGMHATNLVAFVAGGLVVGAGAGVLFKTSVGEVAAMASPEKRGETLAGLFLIAYLGLVVPAVGIGIVTRFTSAVTTVTWFAGVVIALLLGVAAVHTHDGRPPRRDDEAARQPARAT
jgi:MFS family permease